MSERSAPYQSPEIATVVLTPGIVPDECPEKAGAPNITFANRGADENTRTQVMCAHSECPVAAQCLIGLNNWVTVA